jgi:hypothetical protein
MPDSIFKKMGSVIATAVQTEATTRQNADTALQTSLTSETNARQSAVSAEVAARQTAIASETSARQAAITTLTNTISALDSAYKSADATLSASITSEITARTNAVSTLHTSIDGKLSTTATAADSQKLAGVDSTGYIRFFQQANAPATAVDGSIWKDTDTGVLYMAANDAGVLTWLGM